MTDPLISVIIPVYNVDLFLEPCLESILRQTYSNIEVICVDDGSTDRSLEICQKYKEKDNRVYVIHKDNQGVSSARNTGVDFAHGQYIIFIDADDYLDKNALKILSSYHNGDGNLIVALNYDRVSAETRYNDYSADITVRTYKHFGRAQVLDLVSVRRGCYIWGMLIPRRLIDDFYLKFPEQVRNLEDVAWIGMALCHVRNIVYIENKLYHYRENPVSITTNCTNYSWQAEHWMKVYEILSDYYSKTRTDLSKKFASKMLRYCKNNFYAECFSGEISYADAKKLGKDQKILDGSVAYLEYFFYKSYFIVRKLINKIVKNR